MKTVPFTRITQACLVSGLLFTLSLVLMFSAETIPPGGEAFFHEHDYVLPTTFFLLQVGFMAGLLGMLRLRAAAQWEPQKALLLVPLPGQVYHGSTNHWQTYTQHPPGSYHRGRCGICPDRL